MRNRKLQRQKKRYIENGIAEENILTITDERLKRTIGYGKNKRPILDTTPWLAVKPGTRIIIRKQANSLKGDSKENNADQ